MTVAVQTHDFDIGSEITTLAAINSNIGAVASFLGTVRATTNGQPLQSITLEHYPGMTNAELERIANEATQKFQLSAIRIIHRYGTLKPGDNIVLVVTAAPHRHDALTACDFVMDFLKSDAPFWKKEVFDDGGAHWVDARASDEKARARWQAPHSTGQKPEK